MKLITSRSLPLAAVLLVAPALAAAQDAALSPAEHTLLQRLVLAEAQGEGELGMALVARSVLNRTALVQSGKITPGTYMARGRSLSDIINGRYQYEPVSSGSIRRSRSAAAMRQAADAIALARDTARLRARLAAEGLSPAQIDRLLSATGFRAQYAFNDPSQSHNRQRLGNHTFNGDRFSARHDVPALFEERYGDGWAPAAHAAEGPAGETRGALGALTAALSGEGPAAGPGVAALPPAPRPVAADATRVAHAAGARPQPRPAARRPSPLEAHVASGRELGFGDQGDAVADLQRRIGVQPTRLFGPTTQEALKRWQEANGVQPTGRVGPTTLAALERAGGEDLDHAHTSEHDAYSNGRRIGRLEVVEIDGKPVAADTARAFLRMREAARRDGVTLRIVSGFRSHAEQTRLYRAYRAGRGNLAARPGYSNHQDGAAVDLNTSDRGVYRWLQANARQFGFVRTVPSEPWHWEYRAR